MEAGHGHGHALTATGRHRRRLAVVLAITLSVMVLEVVGAALSGSLALLADAGHMLTDGAGLAIALGASIMAARPATTARTFGLQRAEILAAFANAVLLVVVGLAVLVGAVDRLVHPGEVEPGLMLLVALVGLVANGVGLGLLSAGRHESLNVRGAYLEVLGDLLGSAAVVVAALVIRATGWVRADAVCSLLIALLILPRAWSLLRDAVDVLLEATPRGVDLADVRRHVTEVPGVLDVHDLHAWTITSGLPVLSAHVVVDDEVIDAGRGGEVLDALSACLSGHFDVDHCTWQLEPAGHREHEPAHHD